MGDPRAPASRARPVVLLSGILLAAAVLATAAASAVLAAGSNAPEGAQPCVAVPILMYHDIANPARQRYNVTTSLFYSHLQWLRDHGYTTVSLDQIAAALRDGAPLPPHPVAITFDDGPRNNISYAVPLLEYFGFRATFFVVPNWISSQPDRLTWADVRDLASRGHWIGSHSLTHRSNTSLKPAALARELAGSREAIYQHTGISPTAYAYPNGRFSAAAERAVQAAGYALAVSTRAVPAQTLYQVYRLNRIEVRTGTPVAALAAWVEPPAAGCRP